MKTQKLLLTLLVFFVISWPSYSRATSGCCSHHGGVCGCDAGSQLCCDGTDSPTCGCASSPTPSYKPSAVSALNLLTPTCNYSDITSLKSQLDSAKNDLQTCTKAASSKDFTITGLKKTNDNQSTWLWIFGIALLGYIIAYYNKKS